MAGMEEEDEDVVLKGSDLHKHLVESGFSDFEIASPSAVGKNVSKKIVKSTWNVSSVLRLPRSLFQWMWRRDDEEAFRLAALQIILKSNLLVEEDSLLVTNLATNDSSQLMERDWMDYHSLRHRWKNMLILAVGASGAALMTGSGAYFNCIYALFGIGHPLSWYRWWRRRQELSLMKDFTNVVCDLRTVLRKSLMLIQEHELISQGFTFATTGSQAWRLEAEMAESGSLHRKRNYMWGLRSNLSHNAWSTLLLSRKGVDDLLLKFPLARHVDLPNHYLAAVEVETLGLVGEDQKEGETLRALKELCQHAFVQLSELMRRFALCFCPDVWIQGSHLPSAKVLLGNMTKEFSTMYKDMTMSYRFFCLQGLERTSGRAQSPGYRSDLELCVHSLVLHLQSALLTSLDLEEKFSLGEEPDMDAGLERLKLEITSCASCLEMACCQVERAKGPSEVPMSGTISPSEGSQSAAAPSSSVTVVVSAATEDTAEDEVFEMDMADISGDEEDVQTVVDVEEERKKRDEAQHSAQVFRELRTVLVGRAKERKRRERRALAAKKGDTDTSGELSPEFSPVPSPVDSPLGSPIASPRSHRYNAPDKPSDEEGWGDARCLPFESQLARDAVAMSRQFVLSVGTQEEICYDRSSDEDPDE